LAGFGADIAGATGNMRLEELIAAWDLGATRLVTLSACETGITDVLSAPDEYLGLSTGWLFAGAIGVISALWLVDDLCTTLLMDEFYRRLFCSAGPNESPPLLKPQQALRDAQLWLRGLHNAEVCEILATYEKLPNLSVQQTALLAYSREEFANKPPTLTPFAEPYWWAGFNFVGA
jgi:CHAT domain-containing protein